MVITKRFYALAALVVASAAIFSGAAPAAASGGPPIPRAPGEEIDIVSVAEVMAQIENDSANFRKIARATEGGLSGSTRWT